VGLTIAELTAVTTVNNDDVFEIEQSGVSKKITALNLSTLLPPAGVPIVDLTTLQQEGDVVAYNGTDWVPGAMPRWRVVHHDAYTITPLGGSGKTITFVGGGPTGGINLTAGDYFSVGLPVRVVQSGNTHYGVCTAVSDTLLTMDIPTLLTNTTITSVSVGSKDMVKHVQMRFVGPTYNSSTTLVLTKGCQHLWKGPTGHLVVYSCSHMNTSGSINVDLQMNGGPNVSGIGVHPNVGTSTTHGAFTDSGPGATALLRANVAISDGQKITAKTTVITGLADYLVICMTFVVP
jgi:hypothetical protein